MVISVAIETDIGDVQQGVIQMIQTASSPRYHVYFVNETRPVMGHSFSDADWKVADGYVTPGSGSYDDS